MTEAHTYKIEGVGEDFIPTATDFSLIDRVISCTDRDGLNLTRRLAREEAIFVRRLGRHGGVGRARGGARAHARRPAGGAAARHRRALSDQGPQRRLDARQPPARSRPSTRVARRGGRQGRARCRGCSRCRSASRCAARSALVEQHDITQIPVFATERGGGHALRQRDPQARRFRTRRRSTSRWRR